MIRARTRSAIIALLLIASAAQAQPAPQHAAAPGRWFAIAFDAGGARHQLGPFGSLEACEAGRVATADRAQAELASRYPPLSDDDWGRIHRTQGIGALEARNNAVSALLAADQRWRSGSLCERK